MKSFLTAIAICLSLVSPAQKKPIKPYELPEPATAFVEKNFPNEAIHHSWKRIEGNDTIFKVALASDAEIEFRRDGSWDQVDGNGAPVRSAFLGPVIIDYIKKSYPGQRVAKAAKDSKKITVTLVNSTKLQFDLNGRFLR